MNHQQIVEEWQKDSNLGSKDVQAELIRTALLHAKYLAFFLDTKSKLILAEKRFNTMKWLKRKYFQGKMELHELEERGWSQWQGLKPSNSELHDLFDADRDLNELHEKVKYYALMVQGLEYILKQVSQRDWSIKTMFEYAKFVNGGG